MQNSAENMVNLAHIYEGWKKHLLPSQATEEDKTRALNRVKICIACPHAEESWLNKVIDGALQKDQLGSGIGCGLCHCPVNQKALVQDEHCPIQKW